MPDLSFGIQDIDILPFAASPALLAKVCITNAATDESIQSILLNTQIRIETTRRPYSSGDETRLRDLFGEPERWGQTLRSMLWTHSTVNVPGFSGSGIAELPVPCTYDFDVTASKYFNALDDGDVPLIFLFSGTIFHSRADGVLQIAQIPWEKEARYRMPIRIWKQLMDHYFPNSAWLRLRKDTFDKLLDYKTRLGVPHWEDALDRLFRAASEETERT